MVREVQSADSAIQGELGQHMGWVVGTVGTADSLGTHLVGKRMVTWQG